MKKILLIGFILFDFLSYSEMALGLVENNTIDGFYKYFGDSSNKMETGAFFVAPLTSKTALDFTNLKTSGPISLVDIKGGNPAINLKLAEGVASGSCTSEELPVYLELWTGSPSESDMNKVFIRFCLKDANGYFGLRIRADGSPVLFPIADVEFLDTDYVVDQQVIESIDEEVLGEDSTGEG
jgi:hypothetical protein